MIYFSPTEYEVLLQIECATDDATRAYWERVFFDQFCDDGDNPCKFNICERNSSDLQK